MHMVEHATPQHIPLLGNTEYEAALDTALAKAQRCIRIFEHTLGRGYNSPQRFDLLRSFLLASRRNRVLIVVHEPHTIDRNCPRVLNLLRLHSHAISIQETHENAKSVYDPFTVVDDHSFVHRFHFDEAHSLALMTRPASTRFRALRRNWEASSPPFPAPLSACKSSHLLGSCISRKWVNLHPLRPSPNCRRAGNRKPVAEPAFSTSGDLHRRQPIARHPNPLS
jgi:hypothetical protein